MSGGCQIIEKIHDVADPFRPFGVFFLRLALLRFIVMTLDDCRAGDSTNA